MPAWQDYEMWIRLASHVRSFYCTDQETYIQDESHDFHRTTRKPFGVIREAFQRCEEIHMADAKFQDRLRLRVNYHSYPQVPMSLGGWGYVRHGLFLKPIYHYLKKRWMLLRHRIA